MNNMCDVTSVLIDRAYACACAKGFHEKELSVEHYLMLVLSEIGEAIEADRKDRRAQIVAFQREIIAPQPKENIHRHWSFCFETFIKDTLEDELADVCIRLYDMCGALGVEPMVEYDTMDVDFKEIFGEDTFCERMYYLSRLLCSTSGVVVDDGTDECLPQVVGQSLSFLFALAKNMGVDLMQHIEWKMRYNEERPYLNGKKY